MRKTLNIVISIILIFSMLPSIAVNAEPNQDGDFSRNVGLLAALGADIPENAKPDAKITRSEFVKYVISMFGMDPTTMFAGNYFKDVKPGETNGADEINAATAMGIVSSNDSKIFRPSDAILYDEAFKVVCEALGYNMFAISQGGYSKGYKSLASSLKLTSGLNSMSGQVTYSDALKLIYNMLFTKVTNTDMITYKVEISETTFAEYHRDIIKIKGKITANDITGLYDNNAANPTRVHIDGNEYYIGTTDADKLLGYDVEAYIRYEDEEIVYLTEAGRDTVTEISGMDISDYHSGTLYYRDENRERNIKLSDETPVIYNMVYSGNIKNTDINSIIDGSYNVKIIEDRNGEHSVFITKYETLVVEAVNKTERVIYAKYGKGMYKIDDDAEVDIRLLGDDKEYGFDSMSEWTVLEMLNVNTASGDKRVYITIVDYPVKGYLKGTGSTGEYTTYIIDGTEYIVTDEFLKSGEDLPEMGKKAVFYSDSLGRIVAVDCDVKATYGYLFKAWYDEDLETGAVKIYTLKGEHKTFAFKDKIRFNGNGGVLSKNIVDSLTPQLVIYDVNAKDEVFELSLATDNSAVSGYVGFDTESFTLDAKLQTGSYIFRNYIRQLSTIRETFCVSADTIFMDIPSDYSNYKKYKVAKKDSYGAQGSIPQGAKLYDIDELGNAAVVLIERSGQTGFAISEDAKTGVIKNVYTVVNEDNEICYGFKFIDRESEMILGVKDELEYNAAFGYEAVKPEELREGDLIQYSTDSYGTMLAYKILFRPSDTNSFVNSTGELWVGLVGYYGTVESVSGSANMRYFAMPVNGKLRGFVYNYTLASNYDVTGKHIWIYDSENEYMRTGTADEIMKGDNIYVRMYYGIGQIMVVVR